MNLEYKYLLDGNFHPDSRVWVYQSSRLFTMSEAPDIEEMLHTFIDQWNSHGVPVKGAAHLFFGQFIVLIADESATGVSGCSTDSSVRLMKQFEQQFNVQLFDRTMLAFVIKDKLQLLPLSQLSYAVENGFINGDTLYFNNLVQTQQELLDKWIVPVKGSWLATRVKLDTVS
jgi:hypothetical protein